MNRFGASRHIAFRIEIGVVTCPGGDEIDHLDAADLDHAVARLGVEPGGFGIEHDLAHQHLYRPRAARLQEGYSPVRAAL